jgi:hypothetical protein
MSKTPIERRRFLARLGAGVAVAPLLWLPRDARAGGTQVRSIKRGKRGTTIELGLELGPFPAPGSKWKDDSTWVFVPHHYRAPSSDKVDTVVHFHGHRTTAADAMRKHELREQVLDSKQNVILVVPQLAVRANDSTAGKLEAERGFVKFLGEVRKAIQLPEVAAKLGAAGIPSRCRIGTVAISAHSGGFHAAAQCLHRGSFNVTEVYLFDALYGDRRVFRQWVLERRGVTQLRERHKLVCFYGPGQVKDQAQSLMSEFDADGLSYLHERREGELSRAQLTRGRAIFINTATEHGRVTHQNNTLRDCLFASCFERRLSSDWFENKEDKRKLDKRR